MTSSYSSLCPGCLYRAVRPVTDNTPSWGNTDGTSWSTLFGCGQCGQTWFVCTLIDCTIPEHKNKFYTRRNLKDHARRWHGPRAKSFAGMPIAADAIMPHNSERNVELDADCFEETVAFDYNAGVESVVHAPQFRFATIGTARFAHCCVVTTVEQATNCLVQQALLQSPVSLYLDSADNLSPHAIQLFLHIAKLLMTMGSTHHAVLSQILNLLLGLIPSEQQAWPTMPQTLPEFQSHILNRTNQHSLISLLPVPKVSMLSDNIHAYCCLQEIVAFVLLLPRTMGVAPIPLRLRQLCQSTMMQQCDKALINLQMQPCLVTIGLLFWMDGWDPSASTKNNRSPVHTASATLLCIDNNTGLPFDTRTLPIACSPGKVNHNAVFKALETSLNTLMESKHLLWSHHHHRWTTVRPHILALLMDQPERRGSNNLLGGGSTLHAMFGISCNFEQLERSFAACDKCLRVATRYLDTGNFVKPMSFACRQCYSFLLTRLEKLGKYKSEIHPKLPVEAPGHQLTMHPGLLTFSVLVDAWHYGLRKFVHEQQWTDKDIYAYFSLLCINPATITHFTTCGGNFLLVQAMAEHPNEYGADLLAEICADRAEHPQMYELPAVPAAWGIGTMNQRVEAIMHLAMNTEKAVFKLVLKWATLSANGITLRRHLTPLIESVSGLRLPYVPVRMFKNEKFGGYVAENYRALTMLSPWLFRCLLKDEFIPTAPMVAPEQKPRSKWSRKENTGWLQLRGLSIPPKMSATGLIALVDSYFKAPSGPPAVQSFTPPSVADIRQLLVLLYQVFGTLFATTMHGEAAGNRFDALVVQSLLSIQSLGKACHPKLKKTIWVSKYGLLGLLRCRQHFIDYTLPHSLFEGGIEGEGMVKELRPLCPNAVRAGWPLCLMDAYNRQNILGSLSSGFQSSNDMSTLSTSQHDSNTKKYKSWADVQHAFDHHYPMSLVVLGNENSWACHIMMRMFQVNYIKEVVVHDHIAPLVDPLGYVYHTITLSDKDCVYENTTPVLTFALMLPNFLGQANDTQYCVVDKNWRFIGRNRAWTYLG
jgi:hypothetical protein